MKILEFCKMEIFLALEFLKTLTKKQDNRSCRGKSLQNLYFSSRTYENPITIYMKYIRRTADLHCTSVYIFIVIIHFLFKKISQDQPFLHCCWKVCLGHFFFFSIACLFPIWHFHYWGPFLSGLVNHLISQSCICKLEVVCDKLIWNILWWNKNSPKKFFLKIFNFGGL